MSPTDAALVRRRNQQIAALARHVRGLGKPPVVAGDFNLTMWNRGYRPLEQAAGLANARAGHGTGPSWPALWRLGVPIDHILATRRRATAEFPCAARRSVRITCRLRRSSRFAGSCLAMPRGRHACCPCTTRHNQQCPRHFSAMHLPILEHSLLAACLLTAPAFAQRGAMTVPRNLDQLTDRATDIVRGTVVEARVEKHPELDGTRHRRRHAANQGNAQGRGAAHLYLSPIHLGRARRLRRRRLPQGPGTAAAHDRPEPHGLSSPVGHGPGPLPDRA